MHVGATTEQLAETKAQVRADPGVASLHLLTSADAFREFRCLFAGDPDHRRVTAEDLPASFRVRTRPGTDVTGVADRLQSLPGVAKAITAS
jgi:cell division protein FtsX